MPDEENYKPEEVLEKEGVEEYPIVDKKPEDKKLETEYSQKKKSHRLRNWMIGLSILTAGAMAGDYGLQNSITEVKYLKGDSTEIKLVTTYKPGKGCKNLGWAIKSESLELYNAGTEKANNLWENTEKTVKLEEKVAKAKEITNYDEHKTLYHVGSGVVAGALGAYLFLRRKKK